MEFIFNGISKEAYNSFLKNVFPDNNITLTLIIFRENVNTNTLYVHGTIEPCKKSDPPPPGWEPNK